MEQKDINVNVFSAAPQTCSGEKVFNPSISSAVPQACAAKRTPTYSERLDKLRIFADEAAEELPQSFGIGGKGIYNGNPHNFRLLT